MGPDAAAGRLPRGRHGLSRDDVARSQRERILWAMAETMAEHGYARTSVAQITRAAGVSRESFYEQFRSKEACFAAAFTGAVEQVLGPVGAALGAADGGFAALDDALARYLDGLAARPQLARMFLVEVHAAGPEAMRRRAAIQRELAAGLATALGAADPLAAEAFVVAIAGMVTTRLVDGDLDGLRALHGPLMDVARRLFAAD